MSNVRELIDAIQAGDSQAIEQSFQQEMANRIADRLDTMRVEVAKNMFNEAACSSKMKKEKMNEEEVDEEAELNLEDYSPEEIEAFMQTEDYEQLDELSKTTLASYAKKASSSSDRRSNSNLASRAAYKAHTVGMGGPDDDDDGEKDDRKSVMRSKGIARAIDKLAK